MSDIKLTHKEDTTAGITANKRAKLCVFDTTLDCDIYVKADGTTERRYMMTDDDDATIRRYDINALILGVGTATQLTVSSGAITPIQSHHRVGGEGGVADNLDTITATYFDEGDILILRGPTAGNHAVTIRTGVGGNINCAANRALDKLNDIWVGLYTEDSTWNEIAYANNA